MKVKDYIDFIKQAAGRGRRQGWGQPQYQYQQPVQQPTTQPIQQQRPATPYQSQQRPATQSQRPVTPYSQQQQQNWSRDWSHDIATYNPAAQPMPNQPITGGTTIYYGGVDKNQAEVAKQPFIDRKAISPFSPKMNAMLHGYTVSFARPSFNGGRQHISLGGFRTDPTAKVNIPADLDPAKTYNEPLEENYHYHSPATEWHEIGHNDFTNIAGNINTSGSYDEGWNNEKPLLKDAPLPKYGKRYSELTPEQQQQVDQTQKAVEQVEHPSTRQQLGYIFQSPQHWLTQFANTTSDATRRYNERQSASSTTSPSSTTSSKSTTTAKPTQQEINQSTITNNLGRSVAYPQITQYSHFNQLPAQPNQSWFMDNYWGKDFSTDQLTQKQDLPTLPKLDPVKVQEIVDNPDLTNEEKQIQYHQLLKEHLPENLYNMGIHGMDMPVTRVASEMNDPRYQEPRSWLTGKIRGLLSSATKDNYGEAHPWELPADSWNAMKEYEIEPSLDPKKSTHNVLPFEQLRNLYFRLQGNKNIKDIMETNPDANNLTGWV